MERWVRVCSLRPLLFSIQGHLLYFFFRFVGKFFNQIVNTYTHSFSNFF